jgi:predicted secreted protein
MKNLRECFKDWDRKEFRDNSRSFELEMLYESVKTTLSAQQKNDLARFVRKAKTAEEVNTYMTGMIAKDNVKESFTEDIDEESFNKLKEIAYELDNYIEDKVWVRDFWYDAQFDNTITFSISGDWKHDHLRFNYYASEWLDNRGIDYKISEHITDDSEDDSYDADHTIRIYNLKEL